MDRLGRLFTAVAFFITAILVGYSAGAGASPDSAPVVTAPDLVPAPAPQPGQGDWGILKKNSSGGYDPIGVWIEYRAPENSNEPSVNRLWIVHKGANLPVDTDLKFQQFTFTPGTGSTCSSTGEVQPGTTLQQDSCAEEAFNYWVQQENPDLGSAPIQHKLEQTVDALGWYTP
ncbi:hypothetical protein L6R50_04775 [Myxococcota bacterium]|nr:hypothetical protein [Myxococcota bacterium]